eukprot:5714125-Alexandrium_andersonii.AAC.1
MNYSRQKGRGRGGASAATGAEADDDLFAALDGRDGLDESNLARKVLEGWLIAHAVTNMS